MNILITGGAGFIGSSLAEELVATNNKVIALDNFDSFYLREIKEANVATLLASSNFKLVEGDIRNKALICDIIKSYSVNLVIHLAAKAGVRPSILSVEEYYDVNVNGTLSVLEAMKECGVKDLVFASSSSVYGNNSKVPFSESDIVDNPISPYASTKKSGELLCHVYSHLHGFNITCLRFFTVYGPRQRPDLAIHKFTKLISNGAPIPFFGNGSSARDYTFIQDIVHGIIQSTKKLSGFKIYNLGESNTITLIDLVTELGRIIGKEPIIDYLPAQDGDVNITYATIDKARREIDYNPSVDIHSGLELFVKWYNDNF